jgi:hypothetical protein
VRLITRPIIRWPGTLLNEAQRKDHPFEADWRSTLQLLDTEVRQLGANEAVLQMALDEADIKLDGSPYANARPKHPGVILSVETKKQGPLSFPCDRFRERHWRSSLSGWQANVRAVALAMQALRKVDRYGITTQGEQYVGWKAIGSGIPMGAGDEPKMTAEDAARLLIDAADEAVAGPLDIIEGRVDATSIYREAAKRHHPDVGGDPDLFRKLTEARDLLLSLTPV